jgi:hypothetical protein
MNEIAKLVVADQLGVSTRQPIRPSAGFRAPDLPGIPLFRAAAAAYRCRGSKGTKDTQ